VSKLGEVKKKHTEKEGGEYYQEEEGERSLENARKKNAGRNRSERQAKTKKKRKIRNHRGTRDGVNENTRLVPRGGTKALGI